jgi:hypothetical protein
MKAPAVSLTAAQRSRSRFRTEPLPNALRETRLLVPERLYETIREMAAAQQQRLPAMIGQLLDFAITLLNGSEAPAKPQTRHAMPKPDDPIVTLTQAILASRFPGDTGAARFRQLAFIHLIYAETLRGHRPTGAHLARMSGSQPSQMDKLAGIFRERGVIESTHAPGQNGAPWGKILSIRPDAVDALRRAHVAATGMDIVLDAAAGTARRK